MADQDNPQQLPPGGSGSGQGGEFRSSAETGVATMPLRAGPRDVKFAWVGDQALFEGDIVVNTDPGIAGLVITGEAFRWPDATVPYLIAADLPNKQRVEEALRHWRDRTAIKFVERTDQADYVTFRPGDGCSSAVGRQGGEQVITLGPRCTRGNAIHEIGHAVGLWHEQSREDRDDFVRIVRQNIIDGYEHNFDQQITDGDDVGPYDYGSIMHYPDTAFSKNGQKTIVPVADQSIGQRDGLSDGDVAAVRAIYPNAAWDRVR